MGGIISEYPGDFVGIRKAGRFEIRNLMRADRTTPVIQLCAVIDTNLFQVPPRTANDDDITFP